MELIRALAALIDEPSPAHERLAAALELGRPLDRGEHADLFLFQLYPFASVYLGAEGMLGGEARSRVAGFWRAAGFDAPAEPDHLGALLGLLATLSELEDGEGDEARRLLRRQATAALLQEHLLSWLPPWLTRVEELAPPPGRLWARLLGRTLVREAERAGAAADLREPPPLSAHLAAAPPFDDPRAAGGDTFLRQLLAPVRSGVILVRDDLARCARRTGLGLRQGERRYVLEALLAQDAPATLAWLAGEARRQAGALEAAAAAPEAGAAGAVSADGAGAHAADGASGCEARGRDAPVREPLGWSAAVPDVIAFWTARACRTAALLEGLATGAADG